MTGQIPTPGFGPIFCPVILPKIKRPTTKKKETNKKTPKKKHTPKRTGKKSFKTRGLKL